MRNASDSSSKLPGGWARVRLRDIVHDVPKVQPRSRPSEKIIYVDISSIDNSQQKITSPKAYLGKDAPSRARQLVEAGDILFSTVRTYLKNIAIVDDVYDGQVASTGFCVLRPDRRISNRYIFYLTTAHGFLNPLSQLQRGTSYPAVRNSDVLAQLVPVAPATEQHRIVSKIEELFTLLDAGVAALEKTRAQLRRYRQSVLKMAMVGELTKERRRVRNREIETASMLLERIKEERKSRGDKLRSPSPMDTSTLPDLPAAWMWATLPQLGELNRGRSRHRPRNAPELYGGPYPFIQTGDVRQAHGVIREYGQTYSGKGLDQSRLWPAGTLCITIAANIADTAILGFDACFPDSIVGLLTEPSQCDVRFVEYFFRSAKDRIERYAPATAQKNINVRILSGLAVPLPPLAEQHEIVVEVERRFSVVDEIEHAIEQNLRRAQRLRQSILKQAFEGKLVTQDPSDEPASELLERIRKEKAHHGAGEKSRKGLKTNKHAGQMRLI